SVPITAFEGHVLARLSMTGTRVPLAADSDAIGLSVMNGDGRVVLHREVPQVLHWRRADARSIHLDAVAELEAAADPVDTELEIVNQPPVRSGSTLAFPVGTTIQVNAPRAIRTPKGPANFREWRIENYGSDGPRVQQSHYETKISILLDIDTTA